MSSRFKLAILAALVGVSLQAVFVSNVLGIWSLLELSTLLFITYLSNDYLLKRRGEVMKFFLLQAFSGMILLWILLSFKSINSLSLYSGVTLVLIFKMGAIPLHGWLLSLSGFMGWDSLYLFLTIQKITPLYLLSNFASSLNWLIVALSWVISSLSGLRSKNLKKLFLFSSLFFLGILLFVSNKSSQWLNYLILYSVSGLPIFIFMKESANKSGLGGLTYIKGGLSVLIWMSFLNLGGLPPLPGFFLKLSFVSEFASHLTFMFILFLFSSLLIMYMYLNLSFMSQSGGGNEIDSSKSISEVGFWLLMQFSLSVVLVFLFVGVIM